MKIYTNADWAGCKTTQRSTTDYTILLAEAAVVYSSKKQRSVAASSTEAEYVAASLAAREAVWFRKIMEFIGQGIGMVHNSLNPMELYVDNEACMALAKNPKHHSRMKHIDVQYHYIREQVVGGTIRLERVDSSNNVANIFTKPLNKVRYKNLTRRLGMHTRDG